MEHDPIRNILQSEADRQKTGNVFLGRAHDLVQSHKAATLSKMRALSNSVEKMKEKYGAHVTSIQYGVINAHHKLISEVRAVLKTLAKVRFAKTGL